MYCGRWLKVTAPLTSSSQEQQLVVIVTTCGPGIGFQNVFVGGNLDFGFKSLVGFQTPWAVFRIAQAQISRTSNFLTWGDKQLGTAKKQTDTTQSNSAIWHNIVQPPNGQMSQFCIRRPLKSSSSGGVWCTFYPLFLKFDTRTKLY